MTVTVLGRRLPAVVTYVVALGLSLVLMLLTVGAAIWQTNRGVELNEAVRASLETRSHLRLLLRALQDAEIGQRGYLLTSQESYLGPYFSAVESVPRELEALEAAAGANAARQAEVIQIRELVVRKMDEITQTVSLARNGRRNEAMLIVQTDTGFNLMNQLRAAIAAAEAREQADVVERMAAVDRSAGQLRLIVIGAGALLIAVGMLLVGAVRNAMRELRASRDEARSAHERLMQEMGVREQAESKVRQMQKMEAIGQLTGGVAHDFNNMLAVIISALQLAQRRLARGETDIARFTDAAMDAARRAATLTSRLLAFARRQPLQPVVLDPNRVLGGMQELLRRTLGEQVEFEMVLGGGVWRVNADVSELENAIVNVCVNARDAMPGGGKLTIESANAFLDDAYAASNVDVTAGQYVMIAVTDTGVGMAPEVKAKVFEPFFTTKEIGKGTGLGLAHVHGFLKQSGGHVAIYSEVGHGTTVKLYLPRTNLAETETPTLAVTEDLPPGDPATIILVVEDDERVRGLSVASLRELGYTVLHAESGARALEMLDTHEGIALLFTDIVMPGMSGRKLADEIKRRRAHVKVLYTTGYTQNAIVHNGVVDSDARLLLKPYSLAELARKIRAVLNE